MPLAFHAVIPRPVGRGICFSPLSSRVPSGTKQRSPPRNLQLVSRGKIVGTHTQAPSEGRHKTRWPSDSSFCGCPISGFWSPVDSARVPKPDLRALCEGWECLVGRGLSHDTKDLSCCHSERSVPPPSSRKSRLYDFRSGRSGGESHQQDELSPRDKVEESLCYFSPAVSRHREPLSHSAKAMFDLLKPGTASAARAPPPNRTPLSHALASHRCHAKAARRALASRPRRVLSSRGP
jgi:hypothetical protein